jgi:Ca2+-binding EF-hand superfamily protein
MLFRPNILSQDMPKSLVKPIFLSIDINQNKRLDIEEFQAIAAPGAGFSRHDLDHDGSISAWELQIAVLGAL